MTALRRLWLGAAQPLGKAADFLRTSEDTDSVVNPRA
jgi:hypothetical protein